MHLEAATLSGVERHARQGEIVGLLEERRVGGQVCEKFKGRGQAQVRRVAHVEVNRRGAPRERFFAEAHGIERDFTPCAVQRLRQFDCLRIGVQQNGFLVAIKARLVCRVRGSFLGLLPGSEYLMEEIAVVVAAVAPIHVHETLAVQPVEHEGVSAHAHDTAGIVHRPARFNFARNDAPPRVGIVFVTVYMMHIPVAESAAHRFGKVAAVRPTRRQSPLHLCRHAAVVRQPRHGINRLRRGIGCEVVVVENEARVHRRARQHVGDDVVLRLPAVERVAQRHGAAVVSNDLLQCRGHAAHDAARLRRYALVIYIVRAGIVVGRTLMAHGGKQRCDSFRRIARRIFFQTSSPLCH